ncbi:tRNA adenosine deaminase-associated protein [Catenuloplanes atrovinosus]|uniref:tRNA adenosine deaminase-associated protein n=1 Tax=Catenuloplanes atrovinosus TaxID=137266 RepID=A0AAE4CD12_9ACTN|nr:tRNA adenosine deaminase-associated protein [Catenuloplanes atrovinosus]MDR7279852.1 putative tRNA adenosine deaminase-associated protein [Catenuloplanes atrovinosus]
MSYFAAALVRGPSGWFASDLPLTGAADTEDIADRLRDVDHDADLSLLFVESDDSYLVIMRLDEGEDPRVFGSDSIFAEESRLGAMLLSDVEMPAIEIHNEIDEVTEGVEEGSATTSTAPDDPEIDPIGDPDLLADLGISSHDLLLMCGREGVHPSDVTHELCEHIIGSAEVVDELREHALRH